MENFINFKGVLNKKQLKKIVGGTDETVSDSESEPKTKDGVIVPPRGN